MASRSAETIEKMKQAERVAERLQNALKSWIQTRKRTGYYLRQIAQELDNVQENVNVAKVTGMVVSILGAVTGIAGIVSTGGLAAPAVIGGAIAAVGGAATGGGAEIVGHLKSKGKLEDAQKALDADKRVLEEIEGMKSKLDTLSIELSKTTGLSAEQVFGAIMYSTVGRLRYVAHVAGDLQVIPLLLPALGIGMVSIQLLTLMGKGMAKMGKGMTMTLAGISTRAVAKTVGSVLVSVTGILIVWDVANLIQISIDLNKRSKTAAAESLRAVAGKLLNHIDELQDSLQDIKKQYEDYERSIRKMFRELLEKISMKSHATNEEIKEVYGYVEMYCSPEWRQTFLHSVNRAHFVFELSRIFHIFGQQIDEHLSRKSAKKGELAIIVIGHGEIDTRVMLPSQFYYMSPSLKTITLYQPWGCVIDATVVYGIANNTIRIGNVSYTGEVMPASPSSWNVLPSFADPPELIPTPTFSPVHVTEGAYKELMHIYTILQGVSDGLVIPYFTGDGNDVLPLPSVPLWVVTHVAAICGAIFEIDIHFRYASCLTVDNPSRETGHVQCSQYCTVDATCYPYVKMTNHFNEAERLIIERLENLNNYYLKRGTYGVSSRGCVYL